MSQDNFTEVTSESWFGRIGNAFGGILFGLLLFFGSFILLFWNEGRSAEQIRTLDEGKKVVVSVSSMEPKSINEGKLVRISGPVGTDEVLTDEVFGLKFNSIKLKRVVEMYQWKEKKNSHTDKQLGGGTQTTTNYTYTETWSDNLINSSEFKIANGHNNPTDKPYNSQEYVAQKVHLDAFLLSDGLKAQMHNFTAIDASSLPLPSALEGKAKKISDGFYIGSDAGAPQVGDVRVKFLEVKPATVTVVARQIDNSFEPYTTRAGGTIEMLEEGRLSADEMFHKAETGNKLLTWILRGVGFLMMWFGGMMILKPLSVLADVLPFLGNLIGGATGLVTFLSALALSFFTIALAWLVYRPLISLPLIIVAGGIVYLLHDKLKKK